MNNLLLSLLATAAMVLMIVLVVPRDESSRIPKIDYTAVATEATKSSGNEIIVPELPTGWWANQAKWLGQPVDAVPRFEVGFVGPENEYIGETHAFGVNPTWIALSMKDVVLAETFTNPGSNYKWEIYQSPVVHEPAKTKDIIWMLQVDGNAIQLYGTGSKSQFAAITKSIEQQLEAK
ncbi:MAG: hypothetical protein RLZ53_1057 [Actinomycetota bacterium]